MSFEGFTEDDINKLKTSQRLPKTNAGTNKNTGNLKKVTFKNNSPVNESTENKEEAINNKPNTKNVTNEETSAEAPLSLHNNLNISNDVKEKSSEESQTPQDKSAPATDIKRKILDLDEFQTRQKLMEEQNRKRKELLAKALEDRTKRTQEEASRLHEIKTEFKRLDALLSNDVKILRKQIEVASFDYMEAQKKYDKVEKEFLETKIALQQKLEKKEMLTEHLCTIIEKNEERKAEKLTELLEKLKINPVDIQENQESKENNVSSSMDLSIDTK